MRYDNSEVNRLLRGKRYSGEEDLLILQPDGTRACAGWELGEGFHLADDKPEKELTDEELLKSAYKQLRKNHFTVNNLSSFTSKTSSLTPESSQPCA